MYLCVFSFYSYETAVNAGYWNISFTINTALTTKSTYDEFNVMHKRD